MMDYLACLGLLVVLVPIGLVIFGWVEVHKLKEAVRQLARRVNELESSNGIAPTATQAPLSPTPTAAKAAPAPFAPAPVSAGAPPPLPPLPIVPEPVVPVKTTTPASIHPTPAPATSVFDWEAFFGVKLFAWIGGFVLFLGIVFLVKYSFDNNLITPMMRVVIGTVVGLALIIIGWITATRGYRVSGQSLCATGVLVLYGNIFAAHVYLHLIEITPAFFCMALVTAAAFFLAVRMNAQVIVVLGLLGGFLTPVLLSTGVDNPGALFGYIAVLNVGIAAVALRKRWGYLILLGAVGTALMQFGWAVKFFDYPKANIAVAILLGFEAQFLAIFLIQRRLDAAENWAARAAMVMGGMALAGAFNFLLYSSLGHRPGFLFTFVLLAEAGLLVIALLRTKQSALVAPIAGLVVFVFLAIWTGDYLNSALLWWGLGGYVAFALLHAIFAFWPMPDSSVAKDAGNYIPLLSLVLICLCVAKNETSAVVWLCLLVINFIAVSVAFVRRSIPAVVIALTVTLFAAAWWLLAAPPELDLRAFLIVVAASGTFFYTATLAAARWIFPESDNVRRNIPALAATMPFLLLLMAMSKLPVVNPTPFFITAFFLAVFLLALGVLSRTSAIALIALIFCFAVEAEWQGLHFTKVHGNLALGWYAGFCALFLGYPFLQQKNASRCRGLLVRCPDRFTSF